MSQERRSLDRAEGAAASPSHAELCRTLAARARVAALGTLAQDPGGYPYTSLVAVAFDDTGRPLLLLSTLAEHTINLAARPEASVLLGEPTGDGNAGAPAVDPLAAGRMTLIGTCRPIEDAGEAEAARTRFLDVHPEASLYAGFADFTVYRLEPVSIRYVGGFGRMSWVDAGEYLRAEIDLLVGSAPGILEHMNVDHADAVLICAQALGGLPEATSATMIGVDRYGFELRAATPEGPRTARIAFPAAITSADEVRVAVVGRVREARAKLAAQAAGATG